MAPALKQTLTEKWCNRCSRWLPFAAFNLARNERCGLQSACRNCTRTRRSPLASRKEKVRAYGITWEQYTAMHASQGGCCRICGVTIALLVTDGETARIDHCHTTGRVRGLLCHSCNAGLGSFRDQPSLLAAAISYLES